MLYTMPAMSSAGIHAQVYRLVDNAVEAEDYEIILDCKDLVWATSTFYNMIARIAKTLLHHNTKPILRNTNAVVTDTIMTLNLHRLISMDNPYVR